MPSTYAHRRFGADVLALLPDGLRATLEQHRELYDIGLHGPDLMFYYKALQSNPVNRLGNAMHEQKGEVFFTRARTVVENAPDKDAALAYALGFVCHFALDSTCHPYVEAYVRESGVGHCEIETEFDNALMREDGLDPHKVLHGQPHQTQPGAGRGHRALLRRRHGGRDAGGDEGDDNGASFFAGGEPRQALGGADRDARRGQV